MQFLPLFGIGMAQIIDIFPLCRIRTRLSRIDSNFAADDLGLQGVRASTAMALAMSTLIIPGLISYDTDIVFPE